MTDHKPLSAKAVIDALHLIPHPEGGLFRETFRSGAVPMKSKGETDPSGATLDIRSVYDSSDRFPSGGARNVLTSIVYMLTREQPRQCVLMNEADHVHYWQGGGRAAYHLVSPDGKYETKVLGPRVDEGDVMQLVVEGHVFKAAELLPDAEYVLIGEAVAPGFDYHDMRYSSAKDLEARVGGSNLERLLGFLKHDIDGHFQDVYAEDGKPKSS